MRAQAHPAYQEESGRLKFTLQQIQTWKNILIEQAHATQEEIDEILSNLADAKKPEDMTQAQQFEMTKLQAAFSRRTVLTLAEKDPYFGRIDLTTLQYEFQRNMNFERVGTKESKGGVIVNEPGNVETLYLGKLGVENEETGDQLIVDWRAPVADLYYAGIQGLTNFEGPYGPVSVNLHLMRRILIENGMLKEISDQEEAAGIDDFLLSRLRENASTGMKDIISTIQKDQNEIIRLPSFQPVIVQGVAGSGKTSVALHRMSYLLYARKKEIYPEDTLILTPSRLFFGYIASVMPDLDIRRCKQKTFSEIALSVLDIKAKLHTTTDWMSTYCNVKSRDSEKKFRVESALLRWKGSLQAISAVDRYYTYLEQVLLPPHDLCTDDGLLLASQTDMQIRYQDIYHLPLEQRVKVMHKWLQTQSKRKVERELERVQDYYQRRLEIARSRHPVHLQHLPNPAAIQLIHERDQMLKRITDQAKEAIEQYRKQMPKKLSLLPLYAELWNEENLRRFWPELPEEVLIEMVKYHQRPSNRIDQEDLALLLRLHEHLYGLSDYYVHVVIDEAQDLNLSEYFMIRRLLRDTASMTIVGDMSQGIYPQRGLLNWSALMNSVLSDKEIVFREMKRSYRSTSEIIHFANPLLELDQITPAEAVRQSGIEPIVASFPEGKSSWNEKVNAAAVQMREWRDHHEVNTIALLCKGTQHCQQVFGALNRLLPGEAVLIESEADVFSNKIVVIPVYLAKGLEFDACIVMDAEQETYNESVADRHLLYVALTRPLHRLAVYHSGELVTALKKPTCN